MPNPTKWPNTPKQFFGKLPSNYLSEFDHFPLLALKELKRHAKLVLIEKLFKNYYGHRKSSLRDRRALSQKSRNI